MGRKQLWSSSVAALVSAAAEKYHKLKKNSAVMDLLLVLQPASGEPHSPWATWGLYDVVCVFLRGNGGIVRWFQYVSLCC